MESFDKTTVEFIEDLHFYRNVLNFVLGLFPSFDAKIAAMKNKVDEIPSNTRWRFLTTVPFKTLITIYQDRFRLRHMAKKRYGIN